MILTRRLVSITSFTSLICISIFDKMDSVKISGDTKKIEQEFEQLKKGVVKAKQLPEGGEEN